MWRYTQRNRLQGAAVRAGSAHQGHAGREDQIPLDAVLQRVRHAHPEARLPEGHPNRNHVPKCPRQHHHSQEQQPARHRQVHGGAVRPERSRHVRAVQVVDPDLQGRHGAVQVAAAGRVREFELGAGDAHVLPEFGGGYALGGAGHWGVGEGVLAVEGVGVDGAA
uniref:(northern house mosquito) hypothetical protein n=1 Tax=Culex pipiens TaxID=7175 RepID=A0A8D8F257_CULPI